MAMALARRDLNQSFSSTSINQVGAFIESASSSTSFSCNGNGASSSNNNNGDSDINDNNSTSLSEDWTLHRESDKGPILTRLLSHRDLFPMILGYLDIKSLLALTSISHPFRREILLPATPNLCCLNIFLQQRTVVCPMAQFENLKDFMAKYRSFKPHHLHFTYSDQSSLMSLVPEVSTQIYNSKLDATFTHPTLSPLMGTNIYGANQSISINITSANRLYQNHHPLSQEYTASASASTSASAAPQQPSRLSMLQHTQHENDQPESASSHSSSNTSLNINTSTHYPASSSSSILLDNALGNSLHSSGDDGNGQKGVAAGGSDSIGLDINMDINRSMNILDADPIPAKTRPVPDSFHDVVYSVQQQQQLSSARSTEHYGNGIYHHQHNNSSSSSSSSSRSSNHTPNHTHHGGVLDLHTSLIPSEAIPVNSSSSSTISPPLSSYGQNGFELSYWQKFALNELFMRLLLFLRTLTIGRTDKPSRRARNEEPGRGDGELSAGVCFFLARCFNVMHDMPDTALESVLWMDVSAKDVLLLITMIDKRDIMVDERYWKRGYWAVDYPSSKDHSDDDGQDGSNNEDADEDDGDWDGFYFLINQEGSDKRALKPKKKSLLQHKSAASGMPPLQKSSTFKGTSSPKATSSSMSLPSSKSVVRSMSLQQQQRTSISSASSSSSSSPIGAMTHTHRDHIHHTAAPVPWQGFEADGSDMKTTATAFYPEELPQAVQLYEALKADIIDVTVVPRMMGKGKKLAMTSGYSGPPSYQNIRPGTDTRATN
ncbi:hypothetical protein BGZ51_005910 [Haplosporangium sp. Z 767]|nr:hypothetical protein BGZ51_005910 [Haplosporangium sp. Z 767]KAF9186250.1 hypothetical protein BGZ50_002579 [Haplosporangium sp. Z 11]